MNRQQFLQLSSLALATLPANLKAEPSSKKELCIFTKPFQHLSFAELADTVAELSVDGLEFPLRAKGHIEPKHAAEALPKLMEELHKRQLNISILASDINSVDAPDAEKLLRLAQSLGIKRYRMGYHRYDLNKSIASQLSDIKVKVKDLHDMNRDIGIQGLYQNHSGQNFFGAPLWDLYTVVKDLDPNHLAVALDTGHTTVEHGKSWPILVQLLKPHIQSVFVKEPLWVNKKVEWKPLGQGQLDPKLFKTLLDSIHANPINAQQPTTISLQVEYLDQQQSHALPAFKQDLTTLRSWL